MVDQKHILLILMLICIVSELSIGYDEYFTSATTFVIMNGQTVIHGSNTVSFEVKFSLTNNVLTISNIRDAQTAKIFLYAF